MISVEKIVNKINKKYNINKVDFAIVIGSGLMEAAVDLTDTVTIPYDKLGMPKSKVKGHSGKFVFGKYLYLVFIFMKVGICQKLDYLLKLLPN